MTRRITSLPALTCFRAAAELGSFSKAAEELNLTHGAVSRAIRILEEDVGTLLFERRNRTVFLTPAGSKLAKAVRSGLGEIEDAFLSLRKESAPPAVTVSCEPTLMMKWLIPRMPLFNALCPSVEIRLVASGGEIQFNSGVDLAIRRNDFRWPQNYFAQHLFDEMVGVICRPDKVTAFFKKGRIQSAAPLLHSRTRPEAWSTWLQLNDQEQDNKTGPEFEHFYFSLQAAIAGLGAAIGPWRLVQDDIAAGMLVAPNGFVRDGSSYHLLSANQPAAGSAAALFQEWLLGLAASEV